jgi:demethylmenaquinone methyltransferase/2-methoxy-6-polyprenyl-1,4-benzoquinol methylase
MSKTRMIQAVVMTEQQVKRQYDRKSAHYAATIARLEERPRRMGLERAAIGPGDRVLEVAVGPGVTLVEIAQRTNAQVDGVDLSPGMLAKAGHAIRAAGLTNVRLHEADARRLPFPDGEFDVLYNSYMLDLIPLEEMGSVLREFHRVLKPGGRLVLVNMSKPDPAKITWFERLYQWLPERLVPRLIGLCRPVVMADHVGEAGFEAVERQYISNAMPSELVTARRPKR